MNKLQIDNIKTGDFIKKEASIYFVKDFKKAGRKYILEYYFRSTKKTSGLLHINGSKEFYEHEVDRIKCATQEEVEILKAKINNKHPNYHFNIKQIDKKQKTNIQSERECIEFLKERGFIIYKQI